MVLLAPITHPPAGISPSPALGKGFAKLTTGSTKVRPGYMGGGLGQNQERTEFSSFS